MCSRGESMIARMKVSQMDEHPLTVASKHLAGVIDWNLDG